MLGVCLAPNEFTPTWDFVEIQFEKSVSYNNNWKFSGPRFGVHSPYYISLTSPKMQKVDDAIRRITESAKVAEKLNADIVVARAGFYSKREPREAMQELIKHCKELLAGINVPLGIETQPRQSQFGSLDEILELSEKVNIVPVINLPAVVHREGQVNLQRVLNGLNKPYIHFNDIVDLEELAAALPQKYTLVAETLDSAEVMRELI